MTIVNELKRRTRNGYSLYLDYRVNGKRVQERTGLTLLDGKDTATRQHNKEVQIRYKYLITEKQKQLMDGLATVPLSVKRQKIDFIGYFEKYLVLNPSNERRGICTLKKLKAFHGQDTLPVTSITEEYLTMFKNYLEEKLTGETPYHYFKFLKMVLKQATKDKLFIANPAADIVVPCVSNEPKNALSIEEIRSLVAAHCPNDIVKRAFLFSCQTGLRFCDIRVLKWSNIGDDNVLRMIQVKTSHPVTVPLVDYAITLMGQRAGSNDLIFPMPTNAGTNKSIEVWVKNAGIEKKITYHSSRHSYATNLYGSGVDIYTTSAAMGHKSIKETPRYVRLSQHAVSDAVFKMESIV